MGRDYLNKNNRPTLNDKSFKSCHYIYRIGPERNPINLGFPKSMITELSCNWSKLAIPGDILESKPSLGDYIFFIPIKKLNQFKISKTKNDTTPYNGSHILRCYLYHAPLEDDYSHIQVDIMHDLNCPNEQLNETRRYDRAKWNNKKYTIIRKNKFLKDMKEEYKFQLALAFDEVPKKKLFKPRLEFLFQYPKFIIPTIAKFFSTLFSSK